MKRFAIITIIILSRKVFSLQVLSRAKRATTSMFAHQSGASDDDVLTRMGLPSPLILGSGSATRREILDEMDIPFLVRVRPIDEKSLGDRCEGSSPDKLVRMLANAKADAFLHDLPEAQRNLLDDGEPKIISNDEQNDSDDKESEKRQPVLPSPVSPGGYIILAADQVVSHRNHILEKPRSLDEARSFVKGYADSPPSTVGAICLLHLPSRERVEGVHSATIHFSKGVAGGGVGDDLISRLVAAGAPVQDCAGGLMVEHPLVREFIVGIDGTEDSVMGLSKKLVWDLLAELREKITKTKDF